MSDEMVTCDRFREPHSLNLGGLECVNPKPAAPSSVQAARDSAVAAKDARIAKLEKALEWCFENLADGVQWGGPFDSKHPQGVYHCTHCDARWKPQGDEKEFHADGCGLVTARSALAKQKGDKP